MRRRTIIFLCLFFFVIGAGITFVAIKIHQERGISRWFTLDELPNKERRFYAFADDYKDLGQSKAFPGIKNFLFKARFIPSGKKKDSKVQLGYVAEFELEQAINIKSEEESISKKETDEKYLVKIFPDRIFYQMYMEFKCFDKNGFPLLSSKSSLSRISSGKSYKYKDITANEISVDVAERIEKIVPKIVLVEGIGVNTEEIKKFAEEEMKKKSMLKK